MSKTGCLEPEFKIFYCFFFNTENLDLHYLLRLWGKSKVQSPIFCGANNEVEHY